MATEYQPLVAVWELTMNCNMRCKHCGSGCEGPIPGELTTEEALNLADDLGRIGLRHITLSGGEPFTRKDWPLIAERLISHGITVAVITNGWLLDEATIAKAAEVGICGFGISIDGTRETHDFIRKQGSFDRIMDAIELIKKKKIPVTAVTCLHGKNLKELPEMKKIFCEKGVSAWQLQAADPMGNLLDHLEWILNPSDIEHIIEFAHDTMQEKTLRMDLADNIGYYTIKETEVRQMGVGLANAHGAWRGCGAGKHVIGIRCNGDIIGCLSIRDDKFIEGNIRETPLAELWNRPGAFAWNRELTKEKLSGNCRTCQYGSYCLAGCGGMKITRFKSITENHFCAYHSAMEERRTEIDQIQPSELLACANQMVQEGEFQGAEMALSKVLAQSPNNIDVLNQLGFVNYSMENYQECLENNRRVIELDPTNAYAHKGMGVCLGKLKQTDEGVRFLKKAIELADPTFTDPYHDCAVVLCNAGRPQEALEVLQKGRNLSTDFASRSEGLYQQLQASLS